MKIKPTSKKLPEPPPLTKSVCEALVDCPRSELLEFVKQVTELPKAKDDLYFWVTALDRFDDIFAAFTAEADRVAAQRTPAGLPLLAVFNAAEETELVVELLRVSTLILERCASRNLPQYNAIEHLTAMLSCDDLGVVAGALEVFTALGRHRKKGTPSQEKEIQRRLACLAKGWVKADAGLTLVDCITKAAAELPVSQLCTYEFYLTPTACSELVSAPSPASAATNTAVSPTRSFAAGLKLIRPEDMGSPGSGQPEAMDASSADGRSTAEIVRSLVDQFGVPLDFQYDLKLRVNICRSLGDAHKRRECLRIRLLALSAFVFSRPDGELVQAVLANNTQLVFQLVELMKHADLPVPLTIAALRVFQGFALSQIKVNTSLNALGVSVQHGFLPTLLRECCTALLEAESAAAMPAHITPYLVVCLFNLVQMLVSYTTGCDAMVASGVVATLVPLIKRELGLSKFSTRAARILEVIFEMNRGARTIFLELGGLDTVVGRVGLELDLSEPDSSATRIGLAMVDRKRAISGLVNGLVHRVCAGEGAPPDPTAADTGMDTGADSATPASASSTASSTGTDNVPTDKPQTCPSERKSLLKVLMRLLLGCANEPAMSTAMRNIIEGRLPDHLETFVRGCRYFGTTLWNLATRWTAEFCNNEPNLLPVLQARGLTDAILEVLVTEVPVSGDVLSELPSMLSALCLNAAGLRQFAKYNPIPPLLSVLVDPAYLGCMSNDTAQLLGGALDELMRHQPSLRAPGVDAIVDLLGRLADIGNQDNITVNTAADASLRRLQRKNRSVAQLYIPPPAATPAATDGEEGAAATAEAPAPPNAMTGVATAEDADSTPTPASTSTPTPAPASSEAAGKPAPEEVPLLEFISNTTRFIEAVLTNSHNGEHARVMAEKGGLKQLLRLYSLSSLPLNFVQSTAAQSLAIAYRALSSASDDSAKEVYACLRAALEAEHVSQFVAGESGPKPCRRRLLDSLSESEALHREIAAVARYADLLTPLIREAHSMGRNDPLISHIAKHECETLALLRRFSVRLSYQLADLDCIVWTQAQARKAKEVVALREKEEREAQQRADKEQKGDDTADAMDATAPAGDAAAATANDAGADASSATAAPADQTEPPAPDADGGAPGGAQAADAKKKKKLEPLTEPERLQQFLLFVIHSMMTSFAQHMRLALNHKRHHEQPNAPTVDISVMCDSFAEMLVGSAEFALATLNAAETQMERLAAISFAGNVVADIRTQLYSIPRVGRVPDERTLHTYLFVFFYKRGGFDVTFRLFDAMAGHLLRAAEADPCMSAGSPMEQLQGGVERVLECHQYPLRLADANIVHASGGGSWVCDNCNGKKEGRLTWRSVSSDFDLCRSCFLRTSMTLDHQVCVNGMRMLVELALSACTDKYVLDSPYTRIVEEANESSVPEIRAAFPVLHKTRVVDALQLDFVRHLTPLVQHKAFPRMAPSLVSLVLSVLHRVLASRRDPADAAREAKLGADVVALLADSDSAETPARRARPDSATVASALPPALAAMIPPAQMEGLIEAASANINDENIQYLVDMGFEQAQAINALAITNNSLQDAAILLAESFVPPAADDDEVAAAGDAAGDAAGAGAATEGVAAAASGEAADSAAADDAAPAAEDDDSGSESQEALLARAIAMSMGALDTAEDGTADAPADGGAAATAAPAAAEEPTGDEPAPPTPAAAAAEESGAMDSTPEAAAATGSASQDTGSQPQAKEAEEEDTRKQIPDPQRKIPDQEGPDGVLALAATVIPTVLLEVAELNDKHGFVVAELMVRHCRNSEKHLPTLLDTLVTELSGHATDLLGRKELGELTAPCSLRFRSLLFVLTLIMSKGFRKGVSEALADRGALDLLVKLLSHTRSLCEKVGPESLGKRDSTATIPLWTETVFLMIDEFSRARQLLQLRAESLEAEQAEYVHVWKTSQSNSWLGRNWAEMDLEAQAAIKDAYLRGEDEVRVFCNRSYQILSFSGRVMYQERTRRASDCAFQASSKKREEDEKVVVPVDTKQLSSAQQAELASVCAVLLACNLDETSLDATLRMAVRLTLTPGVASKFLQAGGLSNALSIRQGATFPGLSVSLSVIMRHLVDDDATLLQVFEDEMRPKHHTGERGAVPISALFSKYRHLLCRNPAVFGKVVAHLFELRRPKTPETEVSLQLEIKPLLGMPRLARDKHVSDGMGSVASLLIRALANRIGELDPSEATTPATTCENKDHTKFLVPNLSQATGPETSQETDDANRMFVFSGYKVMLAMAELVHAYRSFGALLMQPVNGNKSMPFLKYMVEKVLLAPSKPLDKTMLAGARAKMHAQAVGQVLAALCASSSSKVQKQVVVQISSSLRALAPLAETDQEAFVVKMEIMSDTLQHILSKTRPSGDSLSGSSSARSTMVEHKLPDLLVMCLSKCDLNNPDSAHLIDAVLKNLELLTRCALPAKSGSGSGSGRATAARAALLARAARQSGPVSSNEAWRGQALSRLVEDMVREGNQRIGTEDVIVAVQAPEGGADNDDGDDGEEGDEDDDGEDDDDGEEEEDQESDEDGDSDSDEDDDDGAEWDVDAAAAAGNVMFDAAGGMVVGAGGMGNMDAMAQAFLQQMATLDSEVPVNSPGFNGDDDDDDDGAADEFDAEDQDRANVLFDDLEAQLAADYADGLGVEGSDDGLGVGHGDMDGDGDDGDDDDQGDEEEEEEESSDDDGVDDDAGLDVGDEDGGEYGDLEVDDIEDDLDDDEDDESVDLLEYEAILEEDYLDMDMDMDVDVDVDVDDADDGPENDVRNRLNALSTRAAEWDRQLVELMNHAGHANAGADRSMRLVRRGAVRHGRWDNMGRLPNRTGSAQRAPVFGLPERHPLMQAGETTAGSDSWQTTRQQAHDAARTLLQHEADDRVLNAIEELLGSAGRTARHGGGARRAPSQQPGHAKATTGNRLKSEMSILWTDHAVELDHRFLPELVQQIAVQDAVRAEARKAEAEAKAAKAAKAADATKADVVPLAEGGERSILEGASSTTGAGAAAGDGGGAESTADAGADSASAMEAVVGAPPAEAARGDTSSAGAAEGGDATATAETGAAADGDVFRSDEPLAASTPSLPMDESMDLPPPAPADATSSDLDVSMEPEPEAAQPAPAEEDTAAAEAQGAAAASEGAPAAQPDSATAAAGGSAAPAESESATAAGDVAAAVSEAGAVAGSDAGASSATDGTENYEEEFLAALPEDIRQEVLRSGQLQGAASPSAPPAAAAAETLTHANPEFLAALPEDLRREVLAQEQREQERLLRQQQAAASPVAQAAEMDTASMILSLPPDLREEILLENSHDDGFLAQLSPHMAAEARRLRQREMRRQEMRSVPMQGGRSGLPSTLSQLLGRSSGAASKTKKGQAGGSKLAKEGKIVLDNKSIVLLLQLLFSPHAIHTATLDRCFINLSANSKTAALILSSLLSMLAFTSEDSAERAQAVPSSYRLFSNTLPNEGPLRPRLPVSVASRVSATLCTLAINAYRGLEEFFLGTHDTPPQAIDIPGRFWEETLRQLGPNKKGKGRLGAPVVAADSTRPSAVKPIDLLLDLLDHATFQSSPQHLDSLSLILSTIATRLPTEEQLAAQDADLKKETAGTDDTALGKEAAETKKAATAGPGKDTTEGEAASEAEPTEGAAVSPADGGKADSKPNAKSPRETVKKFPRPPAISKQHAVSLISTLPRPGISDVAFKSCLVTIAKLCVERSNIPLFVGALTEAAALYTAQLTADIASLHAELKSIAPQKTPPAEGADGQEEEEAAFSLDDIQKLKSLALFECKQSPQNALLRIVGAISTLDSAKLLYSPAFGGTSRPTEAETAAAAATAVAAAMDTSAGSTKEGSASNAEGREGQSAAPPATSTPAVGAAAGAAADDEAGAGEAAAATPKSDARLERPEVRADLDSLWEAASQCLSELSGNAASRQMVEALNPVIECFFVCHRDIKPTRTGQDGVTPIAPRSRKESRFLQFIETNRTVINAIVKRNPSALASGPFSVIAHHPHVLDFRVKEQYFRSQLKKTGYAHRHERIRLRIRRNHMFEDSYQQLSSYHAEDLMGRIEVNFEGEEGIDAGGLLREWYYKLSHAMMNQNYGLFIQSNIGSETYMPNQHSVINPSHLEYFTFCGRLIAKAIYDHQLLDCHFTRAFYKQILGVPVSWKDIQAVDEPMYKSLSWLLENDIKAAGMEGDYQFSIDVDAFGAIKTIDLKPGGRTIDVTEDTKREYVRLLALNRLTEAIKTQIKSFQKGFYEVIPQEQIALFNEQELEMMISGLPEVDIEDLKANTEYGQSYGPGSPQIQWFWRAVRSFDREERLKLVQFVTGTGKIPVGGFAELVGMSGPQKFNIHKDRNSTARLPQAHTCFNQLDLPEYESYEKLRRMLLLATTEGAEGFGFG